MIDAALTRAGMMLDRADALAAERDSRFKRGSIRYREWTRRIAKARAKAARVRREALHEWSTAIVREASDIIVTAPPVKAMTASPRGDEREWGANVEAVAAINRNTLNQAPAAAIAMLQYKAAEAGIRCDVLTDAAPAIAVGPDLVAVGKLARKASRKLSRKELRS